MSSSRWKGVERRVAAALNAALSGAGEFKPVERIPLLGREGPDLTVNETGLVINVKSRAEIPQRLFPDNGRILQIGKLFCFRLENIARIHDLPVSAATGSWQRLTDWWLRMDRWTRECQPEGITCIIIHRPRMPVGHAGVVIHHTDLWRLSCQIKTH